MSDFKHHILLVGPRLNSAGTNLGGATRSFEEMITYFQAQGISHDVLNTQAGTAIGQVIQMVFSFLTLIWKADVVFINLSQNGIRKLAPTLSRIARNLSKKVIIRPFGSSLKTIYDELSGNEKKRFEKEVLNADILYVQTRMLLNQFEPLGRSVKQLKTSRPKPQLSTAATKKPFSKRFVFLGQVRKEKGIDELIACINALEGSHIIDIYGPIEDQAYAFLKDKPYYKGLLKGQKAVLSALVDYDVLVLPTYYSGEGYPGVIVEAYSAGLPVIATNWKSLPEIVIPDETGLLVSPKSAEALKNAIVGINSDSHARMSNGAFAYYLENFELDRVMTMALEEINDLFSNGE